MDHNQNLENLGVSLIDNTFKIISWLRILDHSFIRYKMCSLYMYIEYLKREFMALVTGNFIMK